MKANFNFIICLFSALITISCSGNTEKNEALVPIDSTLIKKEKLPVTRSWPKDVPKNKYEITSIGIGDFLLYDYPDSTILSEMDISSTTIERSGLKWNSLVLKKGENQWLRAESFQSTGYLTRIFTNSPSFSTRSGIFPGAKASILLNKPLEIINLNGSQWISVLDEGILVKLDKNTTKPDSTARIIEIGIICGDC